MPRTWTLWYVVLLTRQMLSDDWTKSLHLQADRSLELHNQGGTHTRVRLPRFGRSVAYHFPTADALVGASGAEVYRLNLHQGRYLSPYVLGTEGHLVTGCNAIDVNPAHGLLSFGTEGSGIVELWDPRMRRQAGSLSIATRAVLDAALLAAQRQLPGTQLSNDQESEAVSQASRSLAATALSSAADGLNLAVGTNTGHVLLYDLRMDKPYMTKDQGFGLPIKSLSWPGDANAGTETRTRTEAENKVLSADAKVIKIWDKTSGDNLVSIAPTSASTNLNDVQHYPGSGLIFAAVEATQMAAWYVPALGPAPRWCSFVDNVTDEIDTMDTTNVGSSGVNAYEDFKFVDQAELTRLNLGHLVGTPLLRPYMHGFFLSLKLYERARLLAHPTAFEEAKQRAVQAKMEREAESRVRSVQRAAKVGRHVQVNRDLAKKLASEAGDGDSLLKDSRFQEMFTNPEFQVDETSREFALLHPSVALQARPAPRDTERVLVPAQEEDMESDTESLDPDQVESSSSSDDEPEPQRAVPKPTARMPRVVDTFEALSAPSEQDTQTLGERARGQHKRRDTGEGQPSGAATSISWTPSTASARTAPKKVRAPKEETFGMGLSKGAGSEEGYGVEALSEQARHGRTQRRKPTRSASKNAMRAAGAK